MHEISKCIFVMSDIDRLDGDWGSEQIAVKVNGPMANTHLHASDLYEITMQHTRTSDGAFNT